MNDPIHRIEIHTLQPFSVFIGGKPLHLLGRGQRRPLALLKLLVALGGKNVSEQAISDELWPEADGDAAHRAFATTLYRLRRLIGHAPLHLSDRRLSLDPDLTRLDVWSFTEAARDAEWALQTQALDALRNALDRILEVYRVPFLAGEFEPLGILSARERLHSQFLRVVSAAGEWLRGRSDLDGAATLYHRALEIDEESEELYRALMRCHLEQGRIADGLALYERCRRVLQGKAGVTPSQETEVLRADFMAIKREQGASRLPSPETQGTGDSERSVPLPSTAVPVRQVFLRRITRIAAIVGLVAVFVVAAAGYWLRETFHTPDGAVAPETSIGTRPPALAVLPFANLSDDPEQEFFADGISEELITLLAQYRDLAVIARSSTFTYKGRAVDVRTIGREMGADFVLEGSVRRSADRLRITAQLLSADDGRHLWAEAYDRKLTTGDLFAVQDDLANQVVKTLAGEYGVIALTRFRDAARKPPGHLQSYECVLTAYAYNRQISPQNHLKARDCLERVTILDTQYADAWAWLGLLYLNEYSFEYNRRPLALERANEVIQTALRLDPSNPAALRYNAYYLFFKRDPQFFEAGRDAVAANPRDFFTLAEVGHSLFWAGRREESLALLKRAIELSPVHPGFVYLPPSYQAYLEGDFRKGLEFARKVNMPGFFWNHIPLALNLAGLGRVEEAREQAELIRQTYPGEFELAAYAEFRKWFWDEELIERLINGLRDAGMVIPGET
jgi:TolB-like protein/DNA-binding SARP family transcriptional activator